MKNCILCFMVLLSQNLMAQFVQHDNYILVSYGLAGGDGFLEVPEWGLAYNRFITDKLMLGVSYSNSAATQALDDQEKFADLQAGDALLSSNDSENPSMRFYSYKGIGLQVGYKINASTRSALFVKTGAHFMLRNSNENSLTNSSLEPLRINRNSDNGLGAIITMDYRYKLSRTVEVGGTGYFVYGLSHYGGNLFFAVGF